MEEQEKFIVDTGQGIVFDVRGTDAHPLTDADKAKIKARLEEYSATPEAQEQFKILKALGKEGKPGIIQLTVDPTLEDQGVGGRSGGEGIISVFGLTPMFFQVLYHELEHECQQLKYPGIKDPGNYDNSYDYFKIRLASEAEAQLKGLWFELTYVPEDNLSNRGQNMAKIKKRLATQISDPKALRTAVFKEYFEQYMLGPDWESHYVKTYQEFPGGFRNTAFKFGTFFKNVLNILGFGVREEVEFSRMAMNSALGWYLQCPTLKTLEDYDISYTLPVDSPYTRTLQRIKACYKRLYKNKEFPGVQAVFQKIPPILITKLTEECVDVLETVTLPKNIVELGQRTFFRCSCLTQVQGENLETVGENSFFMCSNLKKLITPRLETICQAAFYNCSSLKEVNLPCLKILGNHAFDGCQKLTKFFAPRLEVIEECGFECCEKLTTVLAPSLKTIRSEAFNGCQHLTTITAPNLEVIEEDAFSNCSNLKNLFLPASVQKIGWGAFDGCDKLTLTCATERQKKLAQESGFKGVIIVSKTKGPPLPKPPSLREKKPLCELKSYPQNLKFSKKQNKI